jgi:hypothetical protein
LQSSDNVKLFFPSAILLILSSLKIDNDVTMGLVGDVKTALRKAGQLKINYSAKKRERTKG